MGTMRWEKEGHVRRANAVTEMANKLRRTKLDAEAAELAVRLKSLQVELGAKQAEKELLALTAEMDERELSSVRTRMGELRGADASIPVDADDPATPPARA
jgi:circadian clock protein KaiC